MGSPLRSVRIYTKVEINIDHILHTNASFGPYNKNKCRSVRLDENTRDDAGTDDELVMPLAAVRISSITLNQNMSKTATKVHVKIIYRMAKPSAYSVYNYMKESISTTAPYHDCTTCM